MGEDKSSVRSEPMRKVAQVSNTDTKAFPEPSSLLVRVFSAFLILGVGIVAVFFTFNWVDNSHNRSRYNLESQVVKLESDLEEAQRKLVKAEALQEITERQLSQAKDDLADCREHMRTFP
jgi:hypothetical protein